MDRRSLKFRWPMFVGSVIVLLVPLIGCKSGIESLALLYEGYDIPPEFDGLKGKTVAVVCKPLTDEEFSNAGAHRALAEGICDRLKTHIKDIHVIDSQRVANLIDKGGTDDYLEIGKALKADKVIGVDIEKFGVLDGQTLFRGRADVHIKVYDVANREVEWRKSPPQVEYPRIGSKPASDCPENEFRNEFLAVLAEQIARYFYPHDRYDDCGSDSQSLR